MTDFATKQQQAYAMIRKQIVDGKLAPGSRVTLRNLAERLAMSEIPIREAVRRLEREGLIVSVPHTGLTIAPLSETLLKDMMEMRNALEPLATRLAADRIDDDELAALADLLRQMEEAARDSDSGRYGELNREFHRVIYRATRNTHLYAEILLLWDHFDRYQRIVFGGRSGHMDRSLREHWTIYEALRDHDPEAAYHAMAVHRRNASRWLAEMDGRALTAAEGSE